MFSLVAALAVLTTFSEAFRIQSSNTMRYFRSCMHKSPLSDKDSIKQSFKTIFPFITAATLTYPALVYAAGVAGTDESLKAALRSGYLKEPTQEFKDEEKRVAAYRDAQIKLRKKWDASFEKFDSATEADGLKSQLDALIAILAESDTFPYGVKKVDLVKRCRKRKFYTTPNGKQKVDAVWTTPVEISYQKLIQDFNAKVSPNNKVSEKLF